MANVGIVIVSHSAKVAEGAADMVRQMVGDSVPLAWTGGNVEGGLGTDVAAIKVRGRAQGRACATDGSCCLAGGRRSGCGQFNCEAGYCTFRKRIRTVLIAAAWLSSVYAITTSALHPTADIPESGAKNQK